MTIDDNKFESALRVIKSLQLNAADDEFDGFWFHNYVLPVIIRQQEEIELLRREVAELNASEAERKRSHNAQAEAISTVVIDIENLTERFSKLNDWVAEIEKRTP